MPVIPVISTIAIVLRIPLPVVVHDEHRNMQITSQARVARIGGHTCHRQFSPDNGVLPDLPDQET